MVLENINARYYKHFKKVETMNNNIFFHIKQLIRYIKQGFFPITGKKNKVLISKGGRLYLTRKRIIGNNNLLSLGKGSVVSKSLINIIGNNNQLIIKDNCRILQNSDISIYGDYNTIIIGDNTSFNHHTHIMAQEKNALIEIGEDCMFSNNIIIRNSDSHSILSLETNERINAPADIKIGSHVWVAAKSTILKGVKIGKGSVIGYQSIVTKDIPENVLAVGSPAKVVKVNISWNRKLL